MAGVAVVEVLTLMRHFMFEQVELSWVLLWVLLWVILVLLWVLLWVVWVLLRGGFAAHPQPALLFEAMSTRLNYS